MQNGNTNAARIVLVYFDAGGGHRSAANALQAVTERQGRPWALNLLNIQEFLDPIDPVLRVTGIRMQDVYNRILGSGWTLGAKQGMPVLRALIRAYRAPIIRRLREFWLHERPDMVVSVIPHFNRALAISTRGLGWRVPFVTILTDLADYPPHMWIEPESEFLICGSERAVAQARAAGHTDGRVFRTSGMILHPRFYEVQEVDCRAERERLGLDPECPTGLVMFGGHGAHAMLDIFHRLDACRENLQLIFICGHNERLRHRLAGQRSRKKFFVEGFTIQVPYYMQLSDFFIGKPGPGSVSEALKFQLPVIVEKNAWTLPQERFNADWIATHGAGIVMKSFRQIGAAVEELLSGGKLTEYRANAARLENQAVFEVPEILQKILVATACLQGPAS